MRYEKGLPGNPETCFKFPQKRVKPRPFQPKNTYYEFKKGQS